MTFAYLCASRPGEEIYARIQRIVRELTQFEMLAGLLIIVAVALPWYVAMYVRHGSPFTDRLIFHDMFNRAFHHVHDTNEGDDTSFRFYVWQLGYALFPWTGLAPLGLLWWLRRGTSHEDSDRADASVLLCMWFLFAFCLFSFMGTKFHHYIFPAVPPVAMLIGVVLDDMLGDEPLAKGWSLRRRTSWGCSRASALMALGIARMLPGSFLGTKPDGHLADRSLPLGAVLVVVRRGADGGLRVALPREGRARGEGRRSGGRGRRPGARVAHAGGRRGGGRAAARARRARSRHQARGGRPAGRDPAAPALHVQLPARVAGVARLLARPSPASASWRCCLAGRSPCARCAGTRWWRCAPSRSCWGLWGLDVYMEKTAQHWGQHEVIAGVLRRPRARPTRCSSPTR